MPRPLRIAYPNAWYHVMNRGGNKNNIFLESDDRVIFKYVIKKTVEMFHIHIHAYALMNNHYHLLINTPLGNISKAMKHLDGIYTQLINQKYKRDGALFRGRFKSILVEKENYLLELTRYIHLNGVRAGLFADPKNDPNTSHKAYVDIEPKPDWLITDSVLRSFGDKFMNPREEFDLFVRNGIKAEIGKILDSNRWPSILG